MRVPFASVACLGAWLRPTGQATIEHYTSPSEPRRLRHDPSVEVAPCDGQGRHLRNAERGTARIRRHLIGLVVILVLLAVCWASADAATQSSEAHLVTSVPHPMPDPHPVTRPTG